MSSVFSTWNKNYTENLGRNGLGSLIAGLIIGLGWYNSLINNSTYTAPAAIGDACTRTAVNNVVMILASYYSIYFGVNASAHLGKAQYNPFSTLSLIVHRHLAGKSGWRNFQFGMFQIAMGGIGWTVASGFAHYLAGGSPALGINVPGGHGAGMPCFEAGITNGEKVLAVALGTFITTVAEHWGAGVLRTAGGYTDAPANEKQINVISWYDDGTRTYSAQFNRGAQVLGGAHALAFAMVGTKVTGGFILWQWLIPFFWESAYQWSEVGWMALGNGVGTIAASLAGILLNWLYAELKPGNRSDEQGGKQNKQSYGKKGSR